MEGTKLTPTRHHMSEEIALARHPEAVRVPGSMQLREVCTTYADMLVRMNTEPSGGLWTGTGNG